MKLKIKFALYNALIKGVIIGIIGLLLPGIIQNIVYSHIDKQLEAKAESLLRKINDGFLNEIVEQDCRFDDYNILKEQFISIQALDSLSDTSEVYIIENQNWSVGGEDLSHRVIHKKFIYNNTHYELNIGEGLKTIEQLDSVLVKSIIWIAVIILIVTFFIDLGFAQVLLRPINRIVSKLKAIDDPVKYTPHYIKSTTKEFTYLDKVIEELMLRIKNQFNIEKEFIANVSHELQTPISIIQSRFENLINSGKADDETMLKIIESQKTLGRLSKVIKALLLISKVENAQYEKEDSCKVSELVNEVLEDLKPRFEIENITALTLIEKDFDLVNVNRSLLYTMLFNLINNAIKYNYENGKVTISCFTKNNFNTITISDTGKGIAPENLAHIFERFRRFHANDGNSFGLGLTIVKSIADYHHIGIEVNSVPEKGTEFKLTFKS